MNKLFTLLLPMTVMSLNMQSLFKRWVVKEYIPRYNNSDGPWWDNKIIHSFGNSGIGGKFHAEAAPIVTYMIDDIAYGGLDVRKDISNHVVSRMKPQNSVVAVDFGCGVGISSNAVEKALGDKFNNYQVYGIDTSPEMIDKARHTGSTDVIYVNGNAARKPLRHLTGKVDLVTVFFLMHEAPRIGHYEILDSAWSLLRDQGVIAIVDVSMDYDPSSTMLLGEPYILDYQDTFEDTLDHVLTSTKFRQYNGDEFLTEWVPGHVDLTILRKDEGI